MKLPRAWKCHATFACLKIIILDRFDFQVACGARLENGGC
jgi:hypothetical protein